MTIFLILLTASVLGFTVLNFPYGKIFLGDGGAYVLGHLLVWSAIILVNYDTDVSPFAIFLIFFWPVVILGLQFGDDGAWEIQLIVQIVCISISW